MIKSLHQSLISLFSKNGYKVTFESPTGIEMKNNEFVFSDMMDGEYMEAVLSMCDENLLLSYNIFEKAYEEDIFIDIPEAVDTLHNWKQKMIIEVKRIHLNDFSN